MIYIYPAVVYKEKESEPYVMVLPDVNIVCDGNTVEEALVEAKCQLKIYLQCVNKFNANLAKATDFAEFKEKYKNEMLLLVDCSLNEDEEDNITVLF